MEIKEAVRGRWKGIFDELGIDAGDGNHKWCPICKDGKDRFRLDKDFNETGSWYCNQCSPHAGDGWALVMRYFGINFSDAVEKIKPIVGMVEQCHPKLIEPDKDAMQKLYDKSTVIHKGDIVWKYLEGRGLGKVSPHLKVGTCLKCYEPETKKEHPAMVVSFSDRSGKPVTIHRTYLTNDSKKLPIDSPKKFLSTGAKISGGACRLFLWKEGTLGIAEGIETAICISIVHGIPVWAACSAQLLEAFEPPDGVEKIEIYGDNDLTYTGQAAAYNLAKKLTVVNKISADVFIPPTAGNDWLDEFKDEI